MRRPEDYPPNLVQSMTALLRTPDGQQELRETQAKALWDLGTHRRGFFPISVGVGKTLITFLAPRVLEAKRPVLLIPAALVEKTEREWRASAKHWRIAKHLQFLSYELAGRVSGAQRLELLQPDLIIADEMFRLKNPRAAVTRRVMRYMAHHPQTVFVPLGGSIFKDSIRDFAHLMQCALGPSSTVPHFAMNLAEWADALDEDANPLTRRSPGVLFQLIDGVEDPDLGKDPPGQARRVFNARMNATAGVVSAQAADGYDGSLAISALEYPVNAATEANFRTLRTTMCRPDGWALSEAMQAWSVARQLALGLHYFWDPSPEDAWLEARKRWARFVRDQLGDPKNHRYDSELQVANAVTAGELEDDGLLAAWREIRPTFTINSQPRWHDDAALRVSADWLKFHPRGICWVEHRHFARELSKRSGVTYYGARGYDESGTRFVEDHDKGAIILSIAANSQGRNLQHWWCENLVTAPPSDSERWEQLIARTHRPGQRADCVTVEVLVACREHQESIPRALASADVKLDLLGFRQKLRIADLTWPQLPRTTGSFRWE